MEITYLGHSSFRLKTKTCIVVTDPYDIQVGKFPKDIEADIVTVSHEHEDHNQVQLVKGDPFVINGPGEYEVKGTSVIGIPTFHDTVNGNDRGANTVYVYEVEGLRVAHLGDVGHKLTQSQLDEIGSVDVLFLPVGGVYTIDAATAVEVLRQVDPWIVVPMHYQTEDTKLKASLGGVEQFFKELGKEVPAGVAKLQVVADKLPSELQVIVMERK